MHIKASDVDERLRKRVLGLDDRSGCAAVPRGGHRLGCPS